MIGVAAAIPGVALAAPGRPPSVGIAGEVAAQTTWAPMPPQGPAVDGIADLGDVRLSYWDTGGPGEVIILLHPRTGSRHIWGYQIPVFVAAGYRVIAYSRRSHADSEAGPPSAVQTGLRDLIALADRLAIRRFHLIGSAAGGFIVPECAVKHPERLISMTIACSLAGISDPKFVSETEKLTPEAFRNLPIFHRELCPSYRHGNPAGVLAWLDLFNRSLSGPAARQPPSVELSWAAIASIKTPTLLITGDADPYMPPSRLREVAPRFPNARAAVLREAGHSAYWEQPKAFNRTVLDFIRDHREAPDGRRPRSTSH